MANHYLSQLKVILGFRGYTILKHFFLVFIFFPLLCFAESNTDPRTKDVVVRVDSISISSANNGFKHGITLSSIAKMANRLRAKHPKRMRFEQLQEIADAITLFLREKGYKFHYAFIPPQKTKSGFITISIVEVSLDDVHVTNDTYFPSKRVSDLFRDLLQKPLFQPNVERLVRALRREQGISIFPYYSRGSKPQSVRLNIKVSAKERLNAGLTIDNHGSSSSGKNRALAQVALFNPLNRFDSLSFGMQQSYGEAQNNYGYVFYNTALVNLNHELSAYVSNSVFEIGGEFSALELEGDASLSEVSYTNHFFYGEKIHQSLSLSYAEKYNDFTSGFNDTAAEPDEGVKSLKVSWDVDYSSEMGDQKFQASFYSGEFTLSGQTENRFDFERFVFSYEHFRRFQFGKHFYALEANFSYKHSETRLPSFERTSLTGSSGVRGFEPGQFSADEAKVFALHLHLPTNRFTHAQVGSFLFSSNLFTEWASGSQLDFAGEKQDSLILSNVGLALRASWGRYLTTNIVFASPVGSDSSELDEFRRKPFYLSLSLKR